MRYGSRWEGLDVDIRACALIPLLVPSREGGKQDEGEEGENDGDDEKVGEDDGVLESCCDPDEVERVLIDRQVVDERGRIVGADVATAIAIDADTEVSNTHAKLGVTDNVGDGLSDARVDLFSGVSGCVLLVPQ